MAKSKVRKVLYVRPYEGGQRRCPVKVAPTKKGKVGIFSLKKIQCKRHIPRSPGRPAKYVDCKFKWSAKPKKELEAWQFQPGHDPGTVTGNPMNWLNKTPKAFVWQCPEKIFVAGKRIKN